MPSGLGGLVRRCVPSRASSSRAPQTTPTLTARAELTRAPGRTAVPALARASRPHVLAVAALAGALSACDAAPAPAQQQPPPAGYVQQQLAGHTVTLPRGFTVSVFAEGLNDVRLMTLGPKGDVYATLTGAGRVVRLPDGNHDGVADFAATVASGLNSPHGIAFRGDTLYVAETNEVVRFDRPEGAPTVVVPNLPSDGGHFTRTILFQQNQMLVSVGSSCNLCEEHDQRRAAVVRYNLDGTGETPFATGLRNSVGLAVNPVTHEVWATNNDRDNLGEELPPDRVNILRQGGFYGWPFCYLPNTPNPEYRGQASRCAQSLGPAVTLPAHAAPLGLAFYPGQMFPAEYRGDLFIALHGSWNRRVPVGYGVVRVHLDQGKPAGAPQAFLSGFREGTADALKPAAGRVWGRPVGLLVLPDGSLLISDDEGGRIYRVTYGG